MNRIREEGARESFGLNKIHEWDNDDEVQSIIKVNSASKLEFHSSDASLTSNQ